MDVQQLNPLTGLPESKKPSVLTVDTIGPVESINTAKVAPQPVKGAYGEYDFAITPSTDFNERRALHQSTGELIGKALGQTASTIVLGTLEVAGYILDPGAAVNAFVNEGQNYEANWFSKLMSDAQDYVNEDLLSVYQTKRAQSEGLSRFADGTFWASNAGSTIGTGLSFLLPGMGVVKGVGALAKTSQLSRAATNVAKTIAPAFVNRHAINQMEASEVFTTQYQKMLDSGADDMSAKNEAGKSAAQAYRLGYLNLIGDIITWNTLLKTTGITNQGLKKSIVDTFAKSERADLKAVAQAAMRNNTSIKDAFNQVQKMGVKEGLGAAFKSGAEEIVDEVTQQFYNNLATRNSDIRMGLMPGKEMDLLEYFGSEEGKEFFTSKEGIDSAVLGFIGGFMFGGAGSIIGSIQARKDGAKALGDAEKQIAQVDYIQRQFQEIEAGTVAGDQTRVDVAIDNMVSDLYFRGVQKKGEDSGFDTIANEKNIANIYEMFNAVENMTAEELKTFGLNEQSKESAKIITKKLQDIETIHNRYANKLFGTEIDDILAMYMTEQEYKNTNNKQHLANVQSKISELLNSPDIQQVLNTFTPDEQRIFSSQRRLQSLNKAKKLIENGKYSAALSYARIDNVGNIRDNIIQQIDEEVSTINESTKELKGDKKKVNELLKNSDKLVKESDREALLDYNIKEGELLLADLLEGETQELIRSAITSKNDEVQKRVNRFFVKKELADGDYVKKGDEIFKINYDDEKAILTPVDKFLQETEDSAQEKSFAEIIDEGFAKFQPKRIFTQQEYDTKLEEVKDLLSKKDFKSVVKILNTEISDSNFSIDDVNRMLTSSISNHVKSIKSVKELQQFKEEFSTVFNNKKRKAEFANFIDTLIVEMQQANLNRVDRISNMVDVNQRLLRRADTKITKFNAELVELQSKLEDINSELNGVDGRTKLAKELKVLKTTVQESISAIESKIKDANNFVKQINEDIEFLKKTEETMRNGSIEEVMNEFFKNTEEFRKYRDRLSHFLAVSNVTTDNLQQIKEKYAAYINGMIEVKTNLQQIFDKIDTLINQTEDIDKAIEELKKELAYSNLNVNNPDIAKVKNALNKALTNVIRKTGKQNLQELRTPIKELAPKQFAEYYGKRDELISAFDALISDAQSILTDADTIYKVLSDPQLQQDVRHYEMLIKQFAIADYKMSISLAPILVNEKDYVVNSGELSPPKRTAYDVFARTGGFSARINKTGTEYNTDPAQRRFFRFVENTNFNDETVKSQYELKLFKPEQYGIELDLNERYEPGTTIYAAIVDQDGNYVDENGNTFKKFNKDKVLYTSIPYPNWETEKFAKTFELDVDMSILNKMYNKDGTLPDEEVVRIHTEKLETIINEYKAEHDGYLEALNKKQPVFVEIYGKYNGLLEVTEEPNPLSAFASTDNITFNFANKDEMTLQDGTTVSVLPGQSLILYDTVSGNHAEGVRRNISKDEANSVINLLKFYIGKTKVSNNFVNSKGWEGYIDEVNQVSVQDAIRNYIFAFEKNSNAHMNFIFNAKDEKGKDIPGGVVQIRYKKYKTNEDGTKTVTPVEQQFPLFARDKKGLVQQLNPALEKALQEALPNMLTNVNRQFISGKNRNNEYVHYSVTDSGQLEVKEYDSYIDYLTENKIVQVKVPPKEVQTLSLEDGSTVEEENVRFHNQTLYIKPREVKTKSNIITDTEADTVDNKKPTKKKAKVFSEPELKDPTVKDPSFKEPTEPDLGVPDYLNAIDRIEENYTPPFVDSMGIDVDLESEKNIKYIKEKIKQKKKTSTKTETPKTKKKGRNDDNKFLFSISDNKPIPLKELLHIAEKLLERTGIPYFVLSDSQFQEVIRQEYGETFKDNTPKGIFTTDGKIYYNGDKVDSETAFHEFIHPIIFSISKLNPELFANLISELNSNTELMQDLYEIHAKEDHLFTNGELNYLGWNEFITNVIGAMADDSYKQHKSFLADMWEKISNYVRELLGLETVKVSELKPNMTLRELADLVVAGDNQIDLFTPNIKPGVEELFESNPELANAVYEALGFKSKPDVILPIGTSGSGKSTFIKSLPQENLVVIEPDAMRVEFTGNMNDKSKDTEIYIEAANRAIKAIKQGKQVVFDTTNLTKDKRLPFIEAIKKAIPTANIQYKLMELNPELAKQRIKAQLARGENRAAVSDETIDRHASSYKQMLEDIKSEPISNFEIISQQKQQAQQLYSQYLDTIFPDSQVKDIVYHSRFTVDNIKNKERWKNGFYSGTKDQADLMADMAESSNGLMTTSALLINMQNPKVTTYADRKVEDYKNTNDGFIIEATEKDALQLIGDRDGYNTENFKKEYVVFEPKQIHILGGKQDIEGFKEFVNSSKLSETAPSLLFKVDLLYFTDKNQQITTNSGKTIDKLGIEKENWYLLPPSVKENILKCN
jgi:predicted kinase